MTKISKNQNGFALLESLLIILILVLIGFGGYYVWHSQHTTKSTVATANTTKTNAATSTTPVDPTANWVAYTSSTGKFSVKYPSTWSTATSPSLCSDGIFLLGGNSGSVGVCGSNNFGQITITWQPVRSTCGLSSDTWTAVSTKSVTVSGVSGTETTGTANAGGTVPSGTATTQYCFINGGTMYVADYTKLSTYPDVLSDFNLMVTKTLSFN